jgi:hypothetical protein
MSIKMVYKRELEWEYIKMIRKIMDNGILINKMAAERWNMQVVTLIGGNTRMETGKEMERMRVLMETDTSGNSWMMRNTAMEYTGGMMEKFITENTNRIKKMAKDITCGQMAINIAGNGRKTYNREREWKKSTENYTEINMN